MYIPTAGDCVEETIEDLFGSVNVGENQKKQFWKVGRVFPPSIWGFFATNLQLVGIFYTSWD